MSPDTPYNHHVLIAFHEAGHVVYAPPGEVEPSTREDARKLYVRCNIALLEDSIQWAGKHLGAAADHYVDGEFL